MHVPFIRRPALCGLLFLVALPVSAQEPSNSFEELRARQALAGGNTVRVVRADGTVLTGQFTALLEDSLRLQVHGNTVDVPASSVRRIGRQRPDSTWDGTLIGLGAGIGAGVLTVHGTCDLPDPECAAIVGLVMIPSMAVGGALIGHFVDRLVHGYDTVFEARPGGGIGLTVAPVLTGDRKGVRVAFSF